MYKGSDLEGIQGSQLSKCQDPVGLGVWRRVVGGYQGCERTYHARFKRWSSPPERWCR